jgi:hypothetical protein
MDGRVVERELDLEFDEHAWLLEQAGALRARRLDGLDTKGLAEYLEHMAKREVREIGSRMRVLLMHMLKLQFQPERAGRSWALSIINAQYDLNDALQAASLRRAAETLWSQEWEKARRGAARETDIPIAAFPAANPWTLDEALRWNPPEGQATLRPRPKKK